MWIRHTGLIRTTHTKCYPSQRHSPQYSLPVEAKGMSHMIATGDDCSMLGLTTKKHRFVLYVLASIYPPVSFQNMCGRILRFNDSGGTKC